jgi:Tfp pilus assembly protein PilV
MVEMLMSAFILAIGILGLTMLQTMSLRATRRSQNLGIAVQLAEQVMDEVELEGRLTYLNSNITGYTTPGALNGLTYINNATVDKYYNIDPSSGQPVLTTVPAGALFHVAMTQTVAAGTGLSDVTVQVQFTDAVTSASVAVQRTATISRRILHG